MFHLSKIPLEEINLREGLVSGRAGALNCFEGFVRNHNEGKNVIAMDYEANVSLCRKEAEKILQEVKKNFGIIKAKAFHRVGTLKVGDMAVWVGVTAAHRDDAFKGCRYIIDEMKSRLPIWKKEYYKGGDSGWIHGDINFH